MTEAVENNRGYAFVTFTRSYERMSTFNWFAAKAAAGDTPTKGEYMEKALALYDAMALDIDVTDIDAVHTTANYVVKYLSSSEYSEMVGGKYSRDTVGDRGVYANDDATSPVANKTGNSVHGSSGSMSPLEMLTNPVEDSAYTQLEDSELWGMRIKLLSDKLTPEQMGVLIEYVEGAATMKEAATNCGLDDKGYNRVRHGIRYAMKGLRDEPLLQVHSA